MAEEKKLSAKQERFCEEYIVDYKAKEAAIRAGYSEASARTTAWRMLSNADIAARVHELQEEYNEKHCFADKTRCMKEAWRLYETAADSGDGKTATKSLELIMKMSVMLSENVNHKLNEGFSINVRIDDSE